MKQDLSNESHPVQSGGCCAEAKTAVRIGGKGLKLCLMEKIFEHKKNLSSLFLSKQTQTWLFPHNWPLSQHINADKAAAEEA